MPADRRRGGTAAVMTGGTSSCKTRHREGATVGIDGVSLDFADDHGPPSPQHYAFLVSEPDFDQIFGRIRDRRLPYWADPGKRRPGEVNTNDGGRGVYWEDPSGHFLEIITRPYGSGS